MSGRRPGFDRVRKMGLALADVDEATAYGAPSLEVRGTMFACMASHRSAEPGTLVVRVDTDQRDELIREEPAIYYLTEHYVDYPCVLVRLAKIGDDALRDLLRMGWRFVSARKKPGSRRRRGRGRVGQRRV